MLLAVVVAGIGMEDVGEADRHSTIIVMDLGAAVAPAKVGEIANVSASGIGVVIAKETGTST